MVKAQFEGITEARSARGSKVKTTKKANHQQGRITKRENKNQPQVMSSKRQVGSFRVAPGLKGELGASSANNRRDPRFDSISNGGKFDEGRWRKAYEFLFEQQSERIKELKAQLKKSADLHKSKAIWSGGGLKKRRARDHVLSPEAEADARAELARLLNRQKQDEQKKLEQDVMSSIRKQEADAVKQGKGVYFPKKSVVREKILAAKYEGLKKSGQLEKYLAKRRKKVASKQHKRLPGRRRDSGDPSENSTR